MRTLNKTLSLVLALVLCLGLVGTAFAANYDKYTDADKVGAAYAEAVDVMMGAGIIKGMTETEIGATGTLTREQAAKIVAYVVLGAKVADALKADAAPFKDVAADRWSAGYIAYCVKAGIIKGYGDGKFGPTDELTGYAFAAMLLRAMGYGKTGEYEGDGWSINVAKDAFGINLFAGDEAAAVNTPIQRQQAMLVAFNAIQKPTAVYSKDKETYTAEGAALIAKFGIKSLDDTVNGIAGHKWVKTSDATKAVSGFYTTEKTTATYGAGTTYGKIVADLGITDKSTATVTYYANGVQKGAAVDAKTYLNSKLTVPAGVTVEIVKSGANYKAMATITYVVEAKSSAAAMTTGDHKGEYEFTFGTFGVKLYGAKDAYKGYYAVVPYGDSNKAATTKFLSIEKVEAIEAKATKVNVTAKTVVVNDTTYTVAKVAEGDVTVNNDLVTSTKAYYVVGNALYLIAEPETADTAAVVYDGFAYVSKVEINAATSEDATLFKDAKSTAAAAKAAVYFTDSAEKQVIDLKVVEKIDKGVKSYYLFKEAVKNEIKSTNATTLATELKVSGWMGYTVEDGVYTLYDLDKNYAQTFTAKSKIEKKAVTTVSVDTATLYTNSATVYTRINAKDKTVKTVTGIASIEIAKDTVVLATYAKGAKVVSALYTIELTNSDVQDSTASYAYVVKVGDYTANGYEVTAYVDGAAVTYYAVANTVTAKHVYANMKVDAKNIITSAGTDKGAVSATANDTVLVKDETYYVTKGGAQVSLTPKTLVYNVTGDTTGTADVIEEGDYVVALDSAKVIYIVDAPKPNYSE